MAQEDRSQEVTGKAGKRHVYVAEDSSGLMKVGISMSLDSRMKTLTAERRSSVNIIWATPSRADARDIEYIAHSILEPQRAVQEWFSISHAVAIEAIVAAIARVEDGDLSMRRRMGFPNELRKRGIPMENVSIRLPQELLVSAQLASIKDGRPLRQWIVSLIKDATKENRQQTATT